MPWNLEAIREIGNTFKERHAFIEGFYDGYRGSPGVNDEILEKYKGDVWYAKGGFIIGSIASTRIFWGLAGFILAATVV